MEEADEEELVVVTLKVVVLGLVLHASGPVAAPFIGSGDATDATAAALLVISFSRLLSFSQLARLFRLCMLLNMICSDSYEMYEQRDEEEKTEEKKNKMA